MPDGDLRRPAEVAGQMFGLVELAFVFLLRVERDGDEEIPAPGGFVVVDDAYNASPESMLAAFASMTDRPRRGRLLAVLGEMRELGGHAPESHRTVGRRAAEVFDAICVVEGDSARILAEAAGAEIVPDRAAAIAWVRKNAREGDRVLVKGSHGVRLDEVVKGLTA